MNDDDSFDDDDADYSVDGLTQDVLTPNRIREKMNMIMMHPVYSITTKLEELKKWEKRLKEAEVRKEKARRRREESDYDSALDNDACSHRSSTSPEQPERSARDNLAEVARAIGQQQSRQLPSLTCQISTETDIQKTDLGHAVRNRVYKFVKFAQSWNDRKFNGRFCSLVFQSLGQPRNEDRWWGKGGYLAQALTVISKKRSNDNDTIRAKFQGTYKTPRVPTNKYFDSYPFALVSLWNTQKLGRCIF
jgi:hypothetical protein